MPLSSCTTPCRRRKRSTRRPQEVYRHFAVVSFLLGAFECGLMLCRTVLPADCYRGFIVGRFNQSRPQIQKDLGALIGFSAGVLGLGLLEPVVDCFPQGADIFCAVTVGVFDDRLFADLCLGYGTVVTNAPQRCESFAGRLRFDR